jgi:hypothetical protein
LDVFAAEQGVEFGLEVGVVAHFQLALSGSDMNLFGGLRQVIEAVLSDRFNEFAAVFPIGSVILGSVGVPNALVVLIQVVIQRLDDETECFG